MHQEERNRRVAHNVPRDPAGEQLSQAAVTVATEHKQTGAACDRGFQQGLPDRFRSRLDCVFGACQPVQIQIFAKFCQGILVRRAASNAEHFDLRGTGQIWQRGADCMGTGKASVPCERGFKYAIAIKHRVTNRSRSIARCCFSTSKNWPR